MKNENKNRGTTKCFILLRDIIQVVKNFFGSIFKNELKKDTGLRGAKNGDLYIDKKVFYNRKEVKETIDNLKKSASINSNIEKAL